MADVVVKISADSKDLTKSMAEVSKSLEGVGESANVMGKALQVGALAVAGAGAGIAAGLGVAITAATGYEKSLSAIKAVSGATADEMKQISALALKLGADTSFSASEAAAGIEELIKGGVAISDVMGGGAAAALNLAAAGGVGLADAAEIAANAMSMFGLKGSDMAMVSNQIAGAANASSLSVTDFKFSLGAVGAVANLAGQTFQDTATAIALMGAAGIKGSDAGTSLKTMLMNLVPTTKAQSAAMRELGLLTADGSNKFLDAQGNFQSLSVIAGELNKALAGTSEAYQSMKLEAIFGSDAIRAGAILTKEGAAGFEAMAESMSKVTAEAVAKDRLDNFAGSIEQLKGSLETAAITIGMAFMPALKKVADGLTDLVNSVMSVLKAMDGVWTPTDAFRILLEVVSKKVEDLTGVNLPLMQSFDALTTAVKTVIDTGSAIESYFRENKLAVDILQSALITLVAAGIANLLIALPALATAFAATAAAAVAAGVAMAIAWAPFILGGIVITGLVLGAKKLIENWEGVKEGAKGLADQIGIMVEAIRTKMGFVFDILVKPFTDAWTNIKGIIDLIKAAWGVAGGMLDSAQKGGSMIKVQSRSSVPKINPKAALTNWQNVQDAHARRLAQWAAAVRLQLSNARGDERQGGSRIAARATKRALRASGLGMEQTAFQATGLRGQLFGIGSQVFDTAGMDAVNAGIDARRAQLGSSDPALLGILDRLAGLIDGGLGVNMDGQAVGVITSGHTNQHAVLRQRMGGGLR
jgi:TP901 family phage tail tape measure protein